MFCRLFPTLFFCPDDWIWTGTEMIAIISFCASLSVAIYIRITIKYNQCEASRSYVNYLMYTRYYYMFVAFLTGPLVGCRTHFPIRMVICHGLIRYTSNLGCSVGVGLTITSIQFETFILVFGTIGRYNVIYRLTKFHNYCLRDKIIMIFMNVLFVLLFLLFILASLNNSLQTSDQSFSYNLKKYDKTRLSLSMIDDQHEFVILMYLSILFLYTIAFVIYYTYLIVCMIKGYKELAAINQIINVKKNYQGVVRHYKILLIVAGLFILLPSIYTIIVMFLKNAVIPSNYIIVTLVNLYLPIVNVGNAINSVYTFVYYRKEHVIKRGVVNPNITIVQNNP